MFVFGYLTIDFQRHTAVTVPDRAIGMFGGLINCSNDDYYCAKSRHVSLVLPKVCRPLKVGDSFILAGVTTTVLAEVSNGLANIGIHSMGPKSEYLLGDDTMPDKIYVYWGTGGITRIYDGLGTNLVQRARAGEPIADDQHRFFANGLLTLDPFGPCRPAR